MMQSMNLEDEIEQNVLYPLFDFLSQQRFEVNEIKCNNQDPANMQGRLWEKFIANKMELFINSHSDIIKKYDSIKLNEGYSIDKINRYNYKIQDFITKKRSELDGLYMIYDGSLLIVECKSYGHSNSSGTSKARIKMRIVESATGRNSIFLKIRPTNNETVGLSSRSKYEKKILLKMPIELERIRINNSINQKIKRDEIQNLREEKQ